MKPRPLSQSEPVPFAGITLSRMLPCEMRAVPFQLVKIAVLPSAPAVTFTAPLNPWSVNVPDPLA